MKIFITGIAGAIGSHMAERLLAEGHEVVGVDALTPYYSPDIKKINISDIEAKGAKVFIKDLVVDDLGALLEGVEYIFHFAAQPGISASTAFDEYVRNNIVATEKLLHVAQNLPTLKGFIHASTSSVYGSFAGGDEETVPQPTSYYGVTKLAAEQLALSYGRNKGLPVSVLRFFSVYGERERPEKLYHKLIKAVLEDKEFSIYEGAEKHIRSYTYVSDIIDGCMLVLNDFQKAKGQIFNLGNDTTMTTGEGIDLIEEIIGKKVKRVVLPPRSGDQLETSANITKMRKTFGYNPKVQLKEGLEAEVLWFKYKIWNKGI
ncbi:MAG: NAD-dependent epimerase/dehydratase family protein [Candidatus Zambryskibacteria bacterium]|nr:NAD-dependent epimerase/dehydratase family protein [Candidatus Zambryskibacteria bacterium]